MRFSLSFLGGAQTVTGSKFLVEIEDRRLLVDCGLFQGLKDLRVQNWAPLPLDVKSLDAVLVTHAHLDHVGYLPLLVKAGFRGPIYTTSVTRALAEIILLDASHIQEEDAKLAAEKGYSKHSDPKPLFTQDDARAAIQLFRTISVDKWQSLFEGVRFRFLASGHIPGSAFVDLDIGGERVLFTGDLGRRKPLILRPPSVVKEADYLVIESTYGDRNHSKEPVLRSLRRKVEEAYARGGDLLIPSFAVGRSQDVLHLFAQLARQKQLPPMPIYFDSPMGIEATRVLSNFPDCHRLNSGELRDLKEVAVLVTDGKHSLSLARSRKQKIVIAGSGMMTGGRILNYLEKTLPDKRNTILLVGYQAVGTRGRLLKDGAPEIKVRGEYVEVKAKVEDITGLSAHADQSEIVAWLRNFHRGPRQVFLVHGEPQPCDALRLKIASSLGWKCVLPKQGDRFLLGETKKGRSRKTGPAVTGVTKITSRIRRSG